MDNYAYFCVLKTREVLSAVLLIVMGRNARLRTITHTIATLVRKSWRWKS